MAKVKTCKRCGEGKPVSEFVKSKKSKDGFLGFCSACWSIKMKAGARARKEGQNGTKPKVKVGANSIELANEALSYANGHSKFVVEADDGDIHETTDGREALLKAVEWMAEGYEVSVREEIPLSSLVMRLTR